MSDTAPVAFRPAIAGLHLTALAAFLTVLPIALVDASADLFAGLGVLLALIGTVLVVFALVD